MAEFGIFKPVKSTNHLLPFWQKIKLVSVQFGCSAVCGLVSLGGSRLRSVRCLKMKSLSFRWYWGSLEEINIHLLSMWQDPKLVWAVQTAIRSERMLILSFPSLHYCYLNCVMKIMFASCHTHMYEGVQLFQAFKLLTWCRGDFFFVVFPQYYGLIPCCKSKITENRLCFLSYILQAHLCVVCGTHV